MDIKTTSLITRIMTVLFILTLSIPDYSYSQSKQVPNYNLIEQNIKLEHSNFYYPRLFARFEAGDTTFSIDELQHLYYGYQFHEDYSNFGINIFDDSIGFYLNKSEDLNKEALVQVVRLAQSAVEMDPFDIMNYLSMNYALKRLNDSSGLMSININKCNNIIKAMESTGSGLTFEDKMYVISISHEYDYLKIYGFYPESQQLIESTDYIKIKSNEHNIKGFYFEVSASFNAMKKMFKNVDIDKLIEEKEK